MSKKYTVKTSVKLRQALLRSKIIKQAENKDSKAIVEAFIQGKTGTTSRGRTYYILGDATSRFLMHKLTPIAQIYGTTIYLNSGFVSENNTGVEIQKFLTDRRIQEKYRIVKVSEDVLLREIAFLPPYEIEKLKQHGSTSHLESILRSQSSGGYDSEEEMFQSAFKSSSIIIKATFYKKIEEILLKGANNPKEVIDAFSGLPKITLTNQEEALLQKLDSVKSPFVYRIYSAINKHNTRVIESYYDIVAKILRKGVDLGSFDLEQDYKQNIQPNITPEEKNIFRSYIKKLSDAYGQLKNSPILLEAYKKANEPDFFTVLSRLNDKDFEKIKEKKDDIGLLKTENQSALRSYLSQLNVWVNQVFSKAKFNAITRMEAIPKPQRYSYYVSKELESQYNLMNQALEKTINTVFSDPEVQQALNDTAAVSKDIVSTLIRTGGGIEEEINFNPKQPIQKLVKDFLYAAFKFRGFGLQSNDRKPGTENYFSNTGPDILKYQAFTNSILNEDLAKKIKAGYIWSGVFIDEYSSAVVRSGAPIEIPLGTMAYGARGGKEDDQFSRKTILGNGQILKVEVEDNFLRFSVHTYHATLTGQQRQTEVKRILENSVEMFRMHHEITKVLTATGVGDRIQAKILGKSSDYEKELKAFFKDKDAPVNCFLVNSGGTLALSEMGTGDYFNSENVRSRGFTYYELLELYQQLASGKAKDKFMDSLFQYEIKGCLEALERYIDTCVKNGEEKLQKLIEQGLVDTRDSHWLIDKEFYRQNIIADLQYHVGDQFQFGTHAFYPLYDESGRGKSFVAKANRAFIVRSSVNPVLVNVSAVYGVDNIGNDILTHAQKNLKVYKKLLADFNKNISENGIRFELMEGSPAALPIMHQGPIITDLRTIINHSRQRYINPTGRTVTIPIADYLKGDLGDKYGSYFDANYHIQYHNDLETLLDKMENIYQLNLQLADLMNLSKEEFRMSDDAKEETTKFIDQFNKKLSLQLGVALRSRVVTQITNGLISLREIVNDIDNFAESVSPIDKESGKVIQEHILSKIPTERIKETYVETVSDVLKGIYEDTLALLDKAYDPNSLSASTEKTNTAMQNFIKKMQEFDKIRWRLRKESKELMLILGKYAADKGMLVDMIKTGRVLNFLLSEAEQKKRSKERKDKKDQQDMGGEE
jgi:hypothetical protein